MDLPKTVTENGQTFHHILFHHEGIGRIIICFHSRRTDLIDDLFLHLQITGK